MKPDAGELYLGTILDPTSGESTGSPFLMEAADLTTHGVIVGMTGSGKTGLGIILLEEALLSGIPALVIDPKGDMGNLLLNFPDFEPGSFRPWIDESEADREGITADELAARTASMWKDGLAGSDVSSDRMRALRDGTGATIYTPGSSAGVPLDIVGSLAAPTVAFEEEAETLRDEIESYVQSLLTLAGLESDPVSGREHILAATIIERAWAEGRDLDLAELIGAIQTPPFRKLGVFDLDTFFPAKDRTELAMKLNGLVASPSFAAWTQGVPIEIDRLLFEDGKPQAAIITLSHLSDTERQFVVTLLLSKLVTWMRSQSGTSDLRALVYMDEVFGFAPPTAEPPSKKPILTLMKQARAFGVGMVLSTQNPVDLDYKTMSNAGTWMVGRLQTERDKARILEGIRSASGDVDVDAFDARISALGKRQFVVTSARRRDPELFTTRWAMSYLAGPLTRDEIARLRPEQVPVSDADGATQPATPVTATSVETAIGDDASPVAPTVADGVPVSVVDRAAPWLDDLGLDPHSNRLEGAAVATVALTYDDRYAEVDHRETYEAIIYPLGQPVSSENVWSVDHDPRDFVAAPPAGSVYELTDASIDTKSYWTGLERDLQTHLVSSRHLTIYKCSALKLYSRVGETEEEFATRCAAAADDATDAEIAKLKDKYETRIERVRDRISAAERRVQELEVDVDTRKQQELLAGAGDLLGAVLGGRRRGSAISRAASRRGQTRRTQERLASAQAKVDDELADLAELEDDLEDDVLEIGRRWAEAAETIEAVEIPLEKSDVSVTSIGLAWVPVGR